MDEPLNILVVDDDDVDRMALKRVLGKTHHSATIIEAANADEARKLIAVEPVNCIFLDYMLPDSDGKSLLIEFRSNGITVPILMLTGQGDEQLAVELMQSGASDYLPKSTLSAELINRRLNNVIRIYQADVEKRKAQEEQQALIEQLKEAHVQLLQSEKMASIGQLAAGVAHEINNPVGYIKSNISSLAQYMEDIFTLLTFYERTEEHLVDPAARAEIQQLKEKIDLAYMKTDLRSLLDESLEGVNRVKQIVNDLKDFSHVDEAEWQSTDIHKGLDSTLNIVHNELKYTAEVIKEYGQLPPVQCIASQINQVFLNLLVNAGHAIEQQGTITVRTGTKGDEWVWFYVQDTGKGISPDNIKHIFDPFFTTKPVGKGTGLGLSLSYSIIRKHGGHLEVESEIDKGTTFQVWLPVKQIEQNLELNKTL